MNPAPRLRTIGLDLSFGGLHVTRDVSISLAPGARTALIGPNGAGKTTLVNLLSGALRPAAGKIELDGRVVTELPEAERARQGLVRTFQITRLFKELTVYDNVQVAVHSRAGMGMSVVVPRSVASMTRDKVHAALHAVGLQSLAKRIVSTLSLGEQRLVEIAIALAMEPRMLLLDEPAAGVPQGDSGRILEAIEALPGDLSILLIEHDMDLVFRFARHIIVLAAGAVVVEGAPDEIARNDLVKEIYFGQAAHAVQ